MRVALGPYLPPAAVQTVLGDRDRPEGLGLWKWLASEAMGEPEGLSSITSIHSIQLQHWGRFVKGALAPSCSPVTGAGPAIVTMAALGSTNLGTYHIR